uniref:Uncharacterized protein n=1 Tax=Anopheles atroparvus TaxID=41427 RepID=A0A182IS26_ANOAO
MPHRLSVGVMRTIVRLAGCWMETPSVKDADLEADGKESEAHQLNVIKLVGTIYAVLIMGVGFIVGLLSGVIESSMLIISAIFGPLLGVFVLAMFMPWPFANWKGAAMGMVVSHLTILWIVIGRLIESSVSDALLDTSIEGCYADLLLAEKAAASNGSVLLAVALEEGGVNSIEASDLLTRISSITYMYYGVFGTVLTVLSGIVFSLATWSSQDACGGSTRPAPTVANTSVRSR